MKRFAPRTWAIVTIFVLLAPTGYAMITQNWLLAALCVGAMLAARVAWLRDDRGDDEDESGVD